MYRPRPGFLRTVAAGLAVLALVVLHSADPRAVGSPSIVISQIYGAGGNTGATYTHDFVELFNRSSSPQSLTDLSIQYTSATGTGLFGANATQLTELPNVTLQPGQYYLVQQAGGSVGTPITADHVDPTPITMAAAAGKVVLVTGTGGLGCNGSSTACTPAQLARIIDLVGYGSANFFEGSGPTGGIGVTTAAFRADGGCTDTDDNAADFTVLPVAPRNTASSLNPCTGPPPPPPAPVLSIDDVSAFEGDAGLTTFTFTVTLSAPAPAAGVVFDIATADGTATVADDDYVPNSATGVTMLGGQTTYTFDVSVVGDLEPESNETFLVNVTNITGATGGKTQGVGTILDDDAVSSAAPLVISQVYGGGGNAGATYTNDFIEIFNRSTSPVSLAGWSVQYASATGTSWQVTTLAGTIHPGQYYLVQQAAGTGGTTPLPTPDAAGGIAMAAGAGKVALVDASTALTGTCPAGPQIIDFVGFGSTASCFEGNGPTPTLSNTTAAHRLNNGCTDTNRNSADFIAAAPAPRNSASAPYYCSGEPPPSTLSINDVTVLEGDAGPVAAAFTVSLSIPATGDVTFDITTIDGSATVADNDYVAQSLTGQVISAGQQTYTFTVAVNGDTQPEPNETFTVELSNITGAVAGKTQGVGTILNDDYFALAIHDIQGDGLITPYFGQPVRTSGVVTGLKTNGFFMQTPDGEDDGNHATSEGLFVFTSTAPAVSVGYQVVVQGTATEFFDLTQIVGSAPGAVTVTTTSAPLPMTVLLTTTILDPNGTPTQLERFEGMRVQAPVVVSVAPSNNFGEIYTVLGGVPRPMREPGIDVTLPVPADPVTGVVDCCIPRWDRNPERIMIDTDGLAGTTPLNVTSNTTLTGVVGPLDFTFGDYKVLLETTPGVTGGMTAVAVPAPGPTEFTVGSFNIQNFTGNATQRAKAALHIRTIMRSPDILGVIEIGSLAALQGLAGQIDADATIAGEPAPGYEARLIPFGTGSQHLGFLVKTSRVQIDSVTQELTGEIQDGTTAVLHDRPPLVLRATIEPGSPLGGEVIVVVNHTRSFINVEQDTAEGARVRAKRTQQAESIAALLQALQADNPAVPVIAVGDYNAYEFNDGHTDPLAILKGLGTDTSVVVVQGSPDLVEPDFVNLTETIPASERYTYIFQGTPQAIDHVLVNVAAQGFVQRYAIARSNADFPTFGLANDASRPESNSDHDSPVAYFALHGVPVVQLLGGATIAHEAFTPFVDPGATAHNAYGPLLVTTGGSVNVNVPGEYVLTYSATAGGVTTTVERTVTVADTMAPVIQGFSLTPTVLGPPNHTMVDVMLSYTVTDASGTTMCAPTVTSNEAPNAPGSGHTAIDWEVVNSHHVRLRAERAGGGSGRIYTVTLTCTDPSGNPAAAVATTGVPHDNRK
jgi:uncharacterized protein